MTAGGGTSRVILVASDDDFLLEHAWKEAAAALGAALGVEPERLSEEAPADEVVLELESPSLFAPARVLVVPGAQRWLAAGREDPPEDPGALVGRLESGLPEGVGLVLAALTTARPAGPLAEAVASAGEVRWVPVPEPPKPWEEGELSRQQEAVLREVLRAALGEVPIDPEAERLLLDRLGFEPRRLHQEARKLAAAAGGKVVDAALVRELVLPAGLSLEVVRTALERGEVRPLLELVEAAASGAEVSDWRGRRLSGTGFAGAAVAAVAAHLERALYLRRLAVAQGLEAELDPGRVAERSWYPRRFKRSLGPRLLEAVRDDPGAPFGRPPSLWQLGGVFRAAAVLSEARMVAALAEADRVEAACRSDRWAEALTRWLLLLEAA